MFQKIRLGRIRVLKSKSIWAPEHSVYSGSHYSGNEVEVRLGAARQKKTASGGFS